MLHTRVCVRPSVGPWFCWSVILSLFGLLVATYAMYTLYTLLFGWSVLVVVVVLAVVVVVIVVVVVVFLFE